MGLPRELLSQIALDVGKRELQVRPSYFKPASSRFELARRLVSTVRPLIGVAMAVVLAGCVTTSPVPSSPFLTAVAAVAAKASPSAMNANAAATDDVATSSVSRPANTPSPGQPSAEQTKWFDRSRRRYAARFRSDRPQGGLSADRSCIRKYGGILRRRRVAGIDAGRGRDIVAARARRRQSRIAQCRCGCCGHEPPPDGSTGRQGDGIAGGRQDRPGGNQASAAGLCRFWRIISRLLLKLSEPIRLGGCSRQLTV